MSQTLTVRHVFSVAILSVLSALLVGGLIWVYGSTAESEHTQQVYSVLSLLVGQGFMLIPVLVFLRYRKESLKHRLRLNTIRPEVVLPVLLISSGVVILADELDRLISLLFPPPELFPGLESLLAMNSAGLAFITILTIVIIAPVAEELIFRGFLQRFLEETWKDSTKAILVTSLFFAAIHMNPFWAVQIYSLGLVLGYMAWRTGSIIPGIILHSLNNSVALAFIKADPSAETIYLWRGHVAPLILILSLAGVLFGFRWLNRSVRAAS